MALEQDVKNEFVILMAEGKSQRQIAKQLNVSLPTIQKWAKELQADIEILKSQNKEQLLNTYRTIKQAHLQNLAGTLTRIDTELTKRDFAEVSTEKLLDFKLKYQKELIDGYEKEPQIFEVDEIETADDYKTEYTRLYNKVLAGEITPNQAKVLIDLLQGKKKIQARQYDIDNPQNFMQLMAGVDNDNPYT